MTHLADEQLDEVMAEAGQPPALEGHLAACERCRRRLAERRAVARRLRRAFASVQAPESLAGRIRAELPAAGAATARPTRRRGRIIRLRWGRLGWALPAAAAIALIFVVPFFLPGEPAMAAQEELALIHWRNLSCENGFHPADDPAKIAAFLSGEAGFVPILPKGGAIKYTGCCVVRFRGRPAASYVIRTGAGLVTIVAADVRIESLKLSHSLTRDGHVLYCCCHGKCRIAAVAIGGRCYTAVGEVDREELVRLLCVLAGQAG